MSSYSTFQGNPIMFSDMEGDSIDIGNLYDKDENGNYYYYEQAKGFELFAISKEGQKWIADRAQAGFKLEGKFVKGLNINIEKEGKLSKDGIDAKLMVDDLSSHFIKYHPEYGGSATAHTDSYIENGRLKVNYILDKVSTGYYLNKVYQGDIDNLTITALDSWLHEILYHGFFNERNYTKNTNYKSALHKWDMFLITPYKKDATNILLKSANKLNLKLTKKIIQQRIQGPGFNIKDEKGKGW